MAQPSRDGETCSGSLVLARHVGCAQAFFGGGDARPSLTGSDGWRCEDHEIACRDVSFKNRIREFSMKFNRVVIMKNSETNFLGK